ncbi:kinase-like domain-containing protein [Rhizophagus irregularis DAOM 181602=DAOM 197198]|uniref:Kinase-like domain-containing protein n=1 Tax=Rhizophagus irregularis (strain DAOM 181602 / DAOM 197198 / MUCL 43194) TaxID=747089 RepID=A0A2P4QGK1_RHIID|nr:kinase-like domain-containing protein [Rhizophagus irregularis DAOM 181602=DAOM 197198]POG76736.1 kinase-like domain-containing protein [Rhizophagus irregularis DAOM 181602=DAOM 197198]|eukprot:XP_025183602.1 kinase-like domain-containing protein [Rhizophagus irregularis DAOM 181602=DAOM 197198]
MVLQYAEGRNFNYWMNNNSKYFNWLIKLKVLSSIISGLKEIHQKQMVHRDFHIGNILFKEIHLFTSNYISDMGLCGEIGNIDETNIYGVVPYVAPEVLRGKTYTQAADIYSFGMIMYFIATEKQPFSNCAHDHLLVIDICKGIRPEINELEAPKCYIDLMKKCWDSNPINRPNASEIEKFIILFHNSYCSRETTRLVRFDSEPILLKKPSQTGSVLVTSVQIRARLQIQCFIFNSWFYDSGEAFK